MAGSVERVEIAHRAAGRENTVTSAVAGPTDQFAHVAQCFRLHEDESGCDFVCEHVAIARRRQPVAGQGHDVEARRQLIEEVRMTCVCFWYVV